MEKLIELLREYNRNKEGYRLALIEYITIDGVKYEVGMKDKVKDMYKYELNIISKKYGFIEWLYDNNKINTVGFVSWVDDVNVENIIMQLAISDTPIDYLISLLK